MNISRVKEMWKEDSKLDETELGYEATRIINLQPKYLELISDERLKKSKFEFDLRVLKRRKYDWVTGKLSEEDLDKFGWEPFRLKVLKNDVDRYLDADDDIIKLEKKITLAQEFIDVLNSILKSLDNRSFIISNAIKWVLFTKGSNV